MLGPIMGGGMRLSFSPGRSKRASRNQRAEAPRRILRAAASLARLSARLHSSAPGAASCIAAAGWHPEQKPVPRGFSQPGSRDRRPRHPPLPAGPPEAAVSRARPAEKPRDAHAGGRAADLPRPSPGEA